MFSCLLLDFFLIIHVEMWEEKSNERENWHFHISHIIRLWLCEWGVKKLRQEREREKNWMSEGCECISWNLFRFRFILRNVQFLSCIGWKKIFCLHFISSTPMRAFRILFFFSSLSTSHCVWSLWSSVWLIQLILVSHRPLTVLPFTSNAYRLWIKFGIWFYCFSLCFSYTRSSQAPLPHFS